MSLASFNNGISPKNTQRLIKPNVLDFIVRRGFIMNKANKAARMKFKVSADKKMLFEKNSKNDGCYTDQF